MPDRLIANASPLIFLSRVGGLGWVSGLCPPFVGVPRGVMGEISAGHDGQYIIEAIEADDHFRVLDDIALSSVVAAWDLGLGESQVLSHCLGQTGVTAVLDDGAARQCGRSLDITVVGTLGVVLAARRKEWIPAARPVIERLLKEGLYLSSSLVSEALVEVGE